MYNNLLSYLVSIYHLVFSILLLVIFSGNAITILKILKCRTSKPTLDKNVTDQKCIFSYDIKSSRRKTKMQL
jgi:hypothetical protein